MIDGALVLVPTSPGVDDAEAVEPVHVQYVPREGRTPRKGGGG
jgi:hypothetical protein